MDYSKLPAKLERIIDVKAFAEKAGLDRSTIASVMRGKHSPTTRTLDKIVKALKEHKPAMRRPAKKAATPAS